MRDVGWSVDLRAAPGSVRRELCCAENEALLREVAVLYGSGLVRLTRYGELSRRRGVHGFVTCCRPDGATGRTGFKVGSANELGFLA